MFENYKEHPSNRNKKVFFFQEESWAAHFESLLKENALVYERQVDTEGDQKIYFGVLAKDFQQAKHLNFLTIGKFRKRFIPDAYLRYFVIFISVLILGLAFIGAYLSNS